MARLIRDGNFDAHLRTLARRTRAAMRDDDRGHPTARAGRRAALRRPQGGLYLWCRVPSGVSARALLDDALAAGVAFVPGHAFYPDPAGEQELRLCFSSVMPNAIEDAVRRLAGCLIRALPVRSVAI